MLRLKSRVGSVLLGALAAVSLGSGAAWSQTGKAWEPLAITVLDSGAYDSALVRADGTVWVWGSPYSYFQEPAPAPMAGLTDAVALSSSEGHTLVLRADGTVWAWGDNMSGQLGDGTKNNRATPMQVPGLPEVAAVAAGQGHVLALTQEGRVWTWGSNYFGELGDGTRTLRFSPAPIPELEKVVSISAGHYHSQAVRKDGTVWGWGHNAFGSVGDGTVSQAPRLTPARVLLPCRLMGLPALDNRNLESRECHGAP